MLLKTTPLKTTQPFDFGDLEGQVKETFAPFEESELRRATDPGSATESIHWGRNYLYVVPWRTAHGDRVPVVVKQFRNSGRKAQLRRRMRGTKARRSFEVAIALESLGIGTPEPLLFADSTELDGPAFFLCEHKTGLLESRYLLRSLSSGTVDTDYPGLDCEAVFEAFGHLARTLHDGKIWHRDLTCGNLLIDQNQFQTKSERAPGSHTGLFILDLNRSRTGRSLSLSERMRDLCRLEVPKPLMAALWSGYFRGARSGIAAGAKSDPSLWVSCGKMLRGTYARAFLLRNRSKKSVRGVGRRLTDLLMPRRQPHAHIPETAESSLREKIVWDQLSDQPHQHASKWEKLRVRVVDAPEHARFLARAVLAFPEVRRRYRELNASRFAEPVTMSGFGVCVRPWPHDPDAVVEAVEDLGVSNVLLRLHPWQQEHGAELELAQTLVAKGVELSFSLPQDRSLVREPQLWRERVSELAQAFAPLGQAFQVGQAPNRSKWGVWKPSEYQDLVCIAAEELRAVRDDVLVLGPSVIDFEFNQTMGYAFDASKNAPRLDGLASLLYVDRRGAPENEQYGLDSVGKSLALRAIADSAPGVVAPQGKERALNWVTEVNWPLWEGPHSPAGRDVAVSEEDQAAYLARYYLTVLASGAVERVYWWQAIAKGYGLIDWQEDDDGRLGLRRRPAFDALATLVRELGDSTFLGLVGTAGEGQWLLRFRTADTGREVVAGWNEGDGSSTVDLPSEVVRVCDVGGGWSDFEGGRRARLSGAVQLFELE